jgi:hypothetical protein
MDAALVRYVRQRAGDRCEYCRVAQDWAIARSRASAILSSLRSRPPVKDTT